MVGVGATAGCITCHADESAGYRAAATMGAAVTGLAQHVQGAHDDLEAAACAGMEMIEARFQLEEAHQALGQSRNLVHTFAAAFAEFEKTAAAGRDPDRGLSGRARVALRQAP
jgi:hypothetical protein